MIRRRITFQWRICCYDEREPRADVNCKTDPDARTWTSPWNTVIVPEEMEEFPESLVMWRDMMELEFEELVKKEGQADCQDIAKYIHLCDYRIRIIDVEEEEIPIVPVFVPPEIINAIKGYDRSVAALRDAAARIPIPELRADFEKRAAELEEKANELRREYGLVGKKL